MTFSAPIVKTLRPVQVLFETVSVLLVLKPFCVDVLHLGEKFCRGKSLERCAKFEA